MKQNEENINYYSIIPATVLYNKDLKANEKLLYAIITSLSNKEGYCFATNNYFAEKLGVNPKTISRWISDLKDKKFIIVELIRNEHKQIIKRKIYINDAPYPLNNGYLYSSKNGQAIHQNIKNNIIKMNKATNGIYRYKKDGKYIISKQGIEWLCKNCFKQKYLELLEDYKMELTEQFIAAGYLYDNFLLKW